MRNSSLESLQASNIFDLEDIILSLEIQDIRFSSPENKRVGKSPLLDDGLNLIYAPQGYGKSFTAIAIAKETGLPSVYFDLESNGQLFVSHCEKYNVKYVYAGDLSEPLKDIKKVVQEIRHRYGKAFIIIDSYSDLFPHADLTLPSDSQKALGSLNKFFMRTVEMPLLLLDHATETENGYKIEGNKSGKFKKTQVVLRLDKIDHNLDNGTYVVVERSRDHDLLKVGHKQIYMRNDYLKSKLQRLIDDGRLPLEFSAKDLEECTSGDDRALWRTMRNEIATSRQEGRKELWILKRETDA